MRTITLREHKTWEPNNDQEEEQVAKWLENLSSRDMELMELSKEYLEINFDPVSKKPKIKASQFVGSVQFDGYGDPEDGFRINVIPKIYQEYTPDVWKKIAEIIDFAGEVSEDDIIESQEMYFEENIEPTLEDSLSYKLIRESNELLRKGLLKSYVVHTENISSLRGKLLLQRQMINDATHKPHFFCEYDELEYDNIDNRIILQALISCERQTRNPDIKTKALRLIQQFSSVVNDVKIKKFDIDRTMNSYTRQNAHYKKIHNTCKLVWEHSGISDFLDAHSSFIQPFFVNMNKKFERFVERLFKKYHGKGEDVHAQMTDDAWYIDDGRKKKMIPDIVLMDGEKLVEIIDVKYKSILYESDLYQIGFYLHEYGRNSSQTPLEKGFAVLPKYEVIQKDGEKTSYEQESIYTATKSKIKIHEKRINVDKILELLKKNESERKIELQKQVEQLLTKNKSGK